MGDITHMHRRHRGHARTRAHALCGAHTRAGARAHTWGTGLERAGMCSLACVTHLDTLLGHRCDVCVTYGHTAVLRAGACPWNAHRAQQHRHTHVCAHTACVMHRSAVFLLGSQPPPSSA